MWVMGKEIKKSPCNIHILRKNLCPVCEEEKWKYIRLLVNRTYWDIDP